jgi:NAD(P)-dependent dehydrogenase (short-subunit alcohol dehydrogenase family)
MSESVFITGADKGLGLALARKFLDEGFLVFAGQYGPDGALGQLGEQFPVQLRILPQDVTDPTSVSASARRVAKISDSLDILINNAGVFFPQTKLPLPEVDLEDGHLESMIEVNAFGPLRVTKWFLPLLEKGRLKRIVNISSEAGSISDCGRESWFGYCMSKAALNMQCCLLQRHLKPKGFKVLAIHPGWLRTDMGGPDADLDPQVSAGAIFALATRNWSLDDPIYMDYTGRTLNW